MNIVTKQIVIDLLFVVMLLGCSDGATEDVTENVVELEQCGDWARIDIGRYFISNNMWNKGALTDYAQCIRGETTQEPVRGGWRWTWPTGQSDVKAYPEIVYGWKPWESRSTTPALPQQINALQTLRVTYDFDIAATGRYNTAFDLWITNAATPTENTITREVMIWIDYQDWHIPAGEFMGNIMIDGEEYAFYNGHVSHANWTYSAFVKVTPQHTGTSNLRDFLTYLAQEQYLSSDEYIASIEFGNEIIEGTGVTTIRSYAIEIE